jgi:hypothetical protein
MCDYSLHHVASRPAKIGEKLVTTGFPGTSTRGFCAVGEPGVAVCLLPGTEVVFEREAEYEHAFNRLLPLPRLGKLGQTVARFRQVNVEQAHAHHDALEFADGRIVLVSRMRLGQRATVLQLPAAARPAQETSEPTAETQDEQPAKHDPLAV